jgi:hypothetical protein
MFHLPCLENYLVKLNNDSYTNWFSQLIFFFNLCGQSLDILLKKQFFNLNNLNNSFSILNICNTAV